MRRAGLDLVALIPDIQRDTHPLTLFDHRGIEVTLVGFGSGSRLPLGLGVREEQQVRNVLVTGNPLLRQVVGPSQEFQYRTDQLLFRHRFVRVLEPAQCLVTVKEVAPETRKRLRSGGRSSPLGGGLDALGEEVIGEQLACHVGFSAPEPAQRVAVGWSLRFRKAMPLDCRLSCSAVSVQQRIIAETRMTGAAITLGW